MKKMVVENVRAIGLVALSCLVLATPARGDGTVYAMTNALGANQIKVYHRAADGTLSLIQTADTSGGGSGTQLDASDSLGSQGALVLDTGHKHLFAVNTETSYTLSPTDDIKKGDCNVGSISSFQVAADGTLTLIEKVASGGFFPNSLTVDSSQNLLYVLNAGGPGKNPVCAHGPNIAGFKVKGGYLSPMGKSKQPLDPGANPGGGFNCVGNGPFATADFQCGLNPPAFPRSPGQIGFAPGGSQLVVTVKGTNSIYVFPVGRTGRAGTPTILKSQSGPNLPTYFGFAFDQRGFLIVSEPFGRTPVIPAAPFSSASSFSMSTSGFMQPVSASVANGRGTSCWVVVYNQYAYTSNNNTSDVSLYKIAGDGTLSLTDASAAKTPGNPNDMAIAVDPDNGSAFLYVLESGLGNVGVFKIAANGTLTSVQSASGLPVNAGAQGLAAY